MHRLDTCFMTANFNNKTGEIVCTGFDFRVILIIEKFTVIDWLNLNLIIKHYIIRKSVLNENVSGVCLYF